MPEELIELDKLMQPDGFVNYYEVLRTTSTATTEELQEGINTLYQEAQMNRDHRVPARRREYQTLLEILPHARLILLDEARRKRYNAYCNAVDMALPRMPYTEFVSALVRERDDVDTRSDILTIRDLSRLRLPNPDEVPEEGTAATTSTRPATATPTVPAPVLKKESVPAPVKEKVTRTEQVEAPTPAPVPTPAPAEVESGPISSAQKFSVQAVVGGLIVLCGLMAALPQLAGVPIVLATLLALICGGVTAYVFSLTGEVIEA